MARNVRSEIILGSGVRRSEFRPFEDAVRLETFGALEVHIIGGERPLIEIEADDNVLGAIRTEVTGGILSIQSTALYACTRSPVVSVFAPSLAFVAAGESSSIVFEGVRSERLSIRAADAAVIDGDGAVCAIDIEARDAASVKLMRMTVQHADVRLSDTTSASLTVNTTLRAYVDDCCSLQYSGEVQSVFVRAGMSGSIKRS